MGTMASLASRKIALLWLSPGARTRRSLSHPPFPRFKGELWTRPCFHVCGTGAR